jgi:hypothetical protein
LTYINYRSVAGQHTAPTMKNLILLAALLTGAVAHAWTPGDPIQLANGRVVFDVQERVRFESRSDNFDFNDSAKAITDDSFVLQRLRLGVSVKPLDWVKIYAQGQDTREWGSKRPDVPFAFGSEGHDPLDLRQAYVEIADPKQCPFSLKIGRQELSYGDERLVGAFDWNNFSRTFDAVKLRWADTKRQWSVDLFAGHVVPVTEIGPASNNHLHFNECDWSDTLAGLYASTTVLAPQTTDFYVLYRNKQDSNPTYTGISGSLTNRAIAYDIEQEIWTLGVRVKSLPGKIGGFDYEAEAALQLGAVAGATTLDHEAFAVHLAGGYTWKKLGWKPRLGLEYNVASGDTDPTDGQSESFMNLFPTNHKFYGYMDFFAWKNIHNAALSLKFTPYQDPKLAFRNVTVQLDGHAFWLYTNDDAWYRANAVTRVRPITPGANPFVGTELDLTVGFTPYKWLKLQGGYSHFFAGDYVRQTASGANGRDDADFGYVQATLTF